MQKLILLQEVTDTQETIGLRRKNTRYYKEREREKIVGSSTTENHGNMVRLKMFSMGMKLLRSGYCFSVKSFFEGGPLLPLDKK